MNGSTCWARWTEAETEAKGCSSKGRHWNSTPWLPASSWPLGSTCSSDGVWDRSSPSLAWVSHLESFRQLNLSLIVRRNLVPGANRGRILGGAAALGSGPQDGPHTPERFLSGPTCPLRLFPLFCVPGALSPQRAWAYAQGPTYYLSVDQSLGCRHVGGQRTATGIINWPLVVSLLPENVFLSTSREILN